MFVPNSSVLRRALRFHIEGSRGGSARLRILLMLERKPMNINEISKKLGVDYKTAQHHIRVLDKAGMIVSKKKTYDNSYVLSQLISSDKQLIKELKDLGKSKYSSLRK